MLIGPDRFMVGTGAAITMLIRNFGIHWERKYVMYGRGRVKGHLKGYRKGGEADFREQIGVYVLSDKDLRPVYVGQAGNGQSTLFNRLRTHERDHLWNRWHHFSWFGFRRVNQNGSLSRHDDVDRNFSATGQQLLNEIEGALISTLEPKLNKQGAKWKDAQEYYQTVEEGLLELTTNALRDSISSLHSEVQGLKRRL